MTVLDYNGDGWPDLFVSNDTQPNKLYRNTGKAVLWKAAWRRPAAWPSGNRLIARQTDNAILAAFRMQFQLCFG